jgi:hypothetical protein
MAVNPEILDRIHQYLLGEMPLEMVQAFEKDLKQHPDWNEAMEVEQELISYLTLRDEAERRDVERQVFAALGVRGGAE